MISARDMEAVAERMESNPFFRSAWPATNRSLLVAAGLPLNPLVLERLAPSSTRCFIRLTAAAAGFHCDILSSVTLKYERPENIFALMAVHLVERTEVGYRLHRMTLVYPSADDLRDDG